MYGSVLLIGMEQYPNNVMAQCRHYPKIPLFGGLLISCLTAWFLTHIWCVFSHCWNIHDLLFTLFVISDPNQCRILNFCHCFDYMRHRYAVTFLSASFSPKAAPIGTPLGHNFVVTAFLLLQTELQIGNGLQNQHLSRYLTDFRVFSVIFSTRISSPSFPSVFWSIHNFFSN